jgi:hypothetical protein
MQKALQFDIKRCLTGLLILFLFTGELISQEENTRLPHFRFNEFRPGIIIMKDGSTFRSLFNYYLVEQEMMLIEGDICVAMDKLADVDSIFIGSFKFIPVDNRFYEILATGKITFYIQHKARFVSTGTRTAYGMTSQVNDPTSITKISGGFLVGAVNFPDNVTLKRESVYWIKKNGKLKSFTNHKQLLNLFPEFKDELKNFVKQYELDIHSREDIIRIAEFCNSL